MTTPQVLTNALNGQLPQVETVVIFDTESMIILGVILLITATLIFIMYRKILG